MPAVLFAPVLAQGVGLVAGAFAIKKWLQEEERQQFMRSSNRCPTCNGTGRTECFCSRWSDGDSGCASCHGTGETACRSCGGGGTAVPIPLRIPLQSRGPNSSSSSYQFAARSTRSAHAPQAAKGGLPVISASSSRVGNFRSTTLPTRKALVQGRSGVR